MNDYIYNNAQRWIEGYTVGYNDGLANASGGGGNTSWTFPEHWPDIPEPAPNQVIIYNEVSSRLSPVAPLITIGYNLKGATVTYGDDGYTYTIPEGTIITPYHVYTRPGKYIMTITLNPDDNGKSYIYSRYKSDAIAMNGSLNRGYEGTYGADFCHCIRAIKTGASIIFNTINGELLENTTKKRVVYVKTLGDLAAGRSGGGLSDEVWLNWTYLRKIDFVKCHDTYYGSSFQNCPALSELTLPDARTVVSRNSILSNCTSIYKVSMPKLTSIQLPEQHESSDKPRAFSQNLYNMEELYAPMLTEISSNEFAECYSLKKLTLSEGCNTNGNVFFYSPQIYVP